MKKLSLLALILTSIAAWGQSVQSIAPMEYWTIYVSNGVPYGYVGGAGTGSTLQAIPLPNGKTAKVVSGCFNEMIAVDNTGNLWLSSNSNSSPVVWTQIATDTTGAAINNAVNVWGYLDTYVLLRADGSLWYGGANDVGIFSSASTGNPLGRPVKLTSTAISFTFASIGAYSVMGIAADGSVYQWIAGAATSPAHITFSGGTGKALYVSAGNGNAWANSSFAIVQQTPGSKYGHPYAWGSNYAIWGGTQSLNTPTDMYATWGLKYNISQIEQSSYAMHLIDSAGNMYGAGYNAQGEVGNGQEFINRYTWPGYPVSMGWDFFNNPAIQQPTGFQQIGQGVKWATLYANRFYTYYWFAQDVAGNIYSWGRGKSAVLGNKVFYGYVLNPADPNVWDQSSPTLVTPFSGPIVLYDAVLPSPAVKGTATVITSSTTVSAAGHPLWMIQDGTTDTICCKYTNYQWTLNGPAGAVLVNPNAPSTLITGLVNGVYHALLTTTDGHNDIDTAGVTFTVSMSTAPVCPTCPTCPPPVICPPPVVCPVVPAPRTVVKAVQDLLTGIITLTFSDNGIQTITPQ